MTRKNGIYLSIDGDNSVWLSLKTIPRFKQQNDPVLEEYEHAKNKKYKRVERYESIGGNVMPLIFDKYKDWLDKAGEMRKLYLQEKISVEEMLTTIRELV